MSRVRSGARLAAPGSPEEQARSDPRAMAFVEAQGQDRDTMRALNWVRWVRTGVRPAAHWVSVDVVAPSRSPKSAPRMAPIRSWCWEGASRPGFARLQGRRRKRAPERRGQAVFAVFFVRHGEGFTTNGVDRTSVAAGMSNARGNFGATRGA